MKIKCKRRKQMKRVLLSFQNEMLLLLRWELFLLLHCFLSFSFFFSVLFSISCSNFELKIVIKSISFNFVISPIKNTAAAAATTTIMKHFARLQRCKLNKMKKKHQKIEVRPLSPRIYCDFIIVNYYFSARIDVHSTWFCSTQSKPSKASAEWYCKHKQFDGGRGGHVYTLGAYIFIYSSQITSPRQFIRIQMIFMYVPLLVLHWSLDNKCRTQKIFEET